MSTLLLVEDLLDLAHLLIEELESFFIITHTRSGREALTLLENKSFDQILTDGTTLDVNGIEILKKIKPETNRAIFMSGEEALIAEASGLGFITFLKPFDVNRVTKILKRRVMSTPRAV